MDPHFKEYLAVIAGMRDLYGERADDRPTEFHDARTGEAVDQPVVPAAA